jgi:antagonist of KipI
VPAVRIREAGDSALLLEVGATHASPMAGLIDADVNARAIAVARAVRQRAIAGVRDVVSTFRSVAVFFDPLATDVAAVAAALSGSDPIHGSTQPLESIHEWGLTPLCDGRIIEVPVAYGGDAGPDLADVAEFAGCSPAAVIDRHASRAYRVFMLGFLPGFAYMASVDETIAAPRRAVPRVRVPAGSVGIAGRQTGVYPRESPGGWQIIGRTAMTLFDPDRTPPALFAPGDEVRFVPTESLAAGAGWNSMAVGAGLPGAPKPFAGEGGSRPDRESRVRPKTDPTTRYVTVLRPGLLTTVQDSGRWGYQGLGVPVSGPMDHAAHRLANAVVGNPTDAATLEATWLGPELRMEQETRVAVAGGDLRAALDSADLPLHAPVCCRPGSVLRFGDRRSGARAYVAFDGGIVVQSVLGSRATHVLSGLGGIEGRAARAGDRIPLGDPAAQADLAPHRAGPAQVRLYERESVSRVVEADLQVRLRPGARLRVLPGPQADYFAASALDVLQRTRYTISPQSDRMGYRLAGGTPVPGVASGEMISDVAFMGGVQLPPSGDPILLMADRPTSGGYPQLAVVITADLPLAGQLGPGDWVEFEVCRRADAIAALAALEGKLLAVR